jgi:uncharacterized protein YjbI with pentapeptide repeats
MGGALSVTRMNLPPGWLTRLWSKQPLAVAAVVVIAAAAVITVFVWPVTDLIASHDVGLITGPTRAAALQTAREAVRTQMLTLGAGVFAAGALAYTARNFRLSRNTFTATEKRVLNERFLAAATQLGNEQAALRLAGVHAMAGLADDWEGDRQTCIDVLCAYLRIQHESETGADALPADPLEFRSNREVRHTVVRLITKHLRDGAAVSWQGKDFDLTGVMFDRGDFSGARFTGGTVNFDGARFAGEVSFAGATFSGATVNFCGAQFTGGTVNFTDARFTGGTVSFKGAKFTGGKVLFGPEIHGIAHVGAEFSGSMVDFADAEFTGSSVVSFTDARFSGGYVSFNDAIFSSGTLQFTYARFSGDKHAKCAVAFLEAKFTGGTADFSYAEFTGGELSFQWSTFTGGKVHFNFADFTGGKVGFEGAEFSAAKNSKCYVSFNGNFTGGTVSFERARFVDGMVGFGGAQFSGGQDSRCEASFANAEFLGSDVNFTRVKFTGAAVSFTEAKFTGGVALFGSEFTSGTVSFEGAEFSAAPGIHGAVSLNQAKFTGVSFTEAKFTGAAVSFTKAKFKGGKADFRNANDYWSCPPRFDWADDAEPPAGVMLPASEK